MSNSTPLKTTAGYFGGVCEDDDGNEEEEEDGDEDEEEDEEEEEEEAEVCVEKEDMALLTLRPNHWFSFWFKEGRGAAECAPPPRLPSS